MNLKFDQFKKLNLNLKELENIRSKNFKKFELKGLPSKKQEQWKYTDLKTIINNNFEDLQIPLGETNFEYNKDYLISSIEHNKIILLNGNFIESNFS